MKRVASIVAAAGAMALCFGAQAVRAQATEDQTSATSTLTPCEEKAIIYARHVEPPLHYPPLARQTRLSGTVVMKLKIAADGSVLSIKSSPGDSRTIGFEILRDDAEKIVKTCTFGCVGCPPDTPFEHTLRFHYGMDEQDVIQDNRVIMNLPDEVTIYTTPVVLNTAGTGRSSKKGNN